MELTLTAIIYMTKAKLFNSKECEQSKSAQQQKGNSKVLSSQNIKQRKHNYAMQITDTVYSAEEKDTR